MAVYHIFDLIYLVVGNRYLAVRRAVLMCIVATLRSLARTLYAIGDKIFPLTSRPRIIWSEEDLHVDLEANVTLNANDIVSDWTLIHDVRDSTSTLTGNSLKTRNRAVRYLRRKFRGPRAQLGDVFEYIGEKVERLAKKLTGDTPPILIVAEDRHYHPRETVSTDSTS